MLEERQKTTRVLKFSLFMQFFFEFFFILARSGAKEKVVRRELCRITTPGTKTYGFLDGDTDFAHGRYLYAICDEVNSKNLVYL